MMSIRGYNYFIRGAAAFLGLSLVLTLIAGLGPDLDEIAEYVDRHVDHYGLLGHGLFVLVTGLFTSLGVPRFIFSFVAGYAFGLSEGVFVATLGSTLGCALSFSYARYFARKKVERRFRPHVARVNNLIRQAPFLMTLCVRLIPFGSNMLLGLLAGVTRIPALPFIAATGLGHIPQNLVFALIGSGFKVDPFWRITLGAILFILAGALGCTIYHVLKKRGAFDEFTHAHEKSASLPGPHYR